MGATALTCNCRSELGLSPTVDLSHEEDGLHLLLLYQSGKQRGYMMGEEADHWSFWRLPVSPSPLCPSHSHVAKVYS